MLLSRNLDHLVESIATSVTEFYVLRAYVHMAVFVLAFFAYSALAYRLILWALARGHEVATVEGVPVVYLKKESLTSYTLLIWKPIVFIAPSHRNDPVVLVHELGHAKSPYFRYAISLYWVLLLLFFGAMYAGDGEHFLDQAAVWALGVGLGFVLTYFLVLHKDELFADAYAIKKLGDAALEERAKWRHEYWAEALKLKGLSRRLAIWAHYMLFPGIPRDLEGIREYLRRVSRDPLWPIGHFSLIAPWVAVYSGSSAYLAGVVLGVSGSLLLLVLASSFLTGIALSYLLAIVLKPVVARLARLDPFKTALMLASSFLGIASFMLPGALLASPAFVPAAVALTLLASTAIARVASDKPLALALASTAVLYAISALVGAVALWRAL